MMKPRVWPSRVEGRVPRLHRRSTPRLNRVDCGEHALAGKFDCLAQTSDQSLLMMPPAPAARVIVGRLDPPMVSVKVSAPVSRALRKLDAAAGAVPMDVDPAHATTYIVNPLTGRRITFAGLFSTHPPTADRIARKD